MKHTVKVWNEEIEVHVYQKSKTVWIATGTYMDHHIEVSRRSASAALSAWRDAAKYRGG